MKKSKYNKKKNKKSKDNSDSEDEKNSPKNDSENEEEESSLNFNGKYYIYVTSNKKKAMSVPRSSKEKGIQMEVDNFTKGGSKQFEISPLSEGYFLIKSSLSGLFLKAKEGFSNDEVVQDEIEDEDSIGEEFKWKIEKGEEGETVYIKNAMSKGNDFYMQIEGGEAKIHSNIILGEKDEEQKFLICYAN